MPRVVYGVMTFHPTHDITVPDPMLTVTQSVPNACNQCHLDRSVNWSIAESKRLWPLRFSEAQLSKDEQFDLPEGPRALFAGDALMRALAADLLSGNGPMKVEANWATPYLVEALADNYPIVRFFAANGLSKQPWNVIKPDYLASMLVCGTGNGSTESHVAKRSSDINSRRCGCLTARILGGRCLAL